MDRRNFFKKLLVTPALFPFLFASKSQNHSFDLFIISEKPSSILIKLLEGLKVYGMNPGKNFSFLNKHPKEKFLIKTLSGKGLKLTQKNQGADFNLSFSRLQRSCFPSFSLVKEGNLLDIRSRDLYSLWKKMSKSQPSSMVTVATFQSNYKSLNPGKTASVFINGEMTEKISLYNNAVKTYHLKNGTINVVVSERKAWISDSCCPQKICLYSTPISLEGERIICAPNHFLIQIDSSSLIDTVIG
ncbi:MAG: NusG domain II-containing protein [Candidatus Aminicenantaceae bacterium]